MLSQGIVGPQSCDSSSDYSCYTSPRGFVCRLHRGSSVETPMTFHKTRMFYLSQAVENTHNIFKAVWGEIWQGPAEDGASERDGEVTQILHTL